MKNWIRNSVVFLVLAGAGTMYASPLDSAAQGGAAADPASLLTPDSKPTHAWVDAYVKAFNTQNPDIFAPEFYAPDIVFERGNNWFTRGREQYVKEYRDMHHGLTEVLDPQRILVDGDNVAIEINVWFEATQDQPNFVLKPVKAGDKFVTKMFAFYKVKDGKFSYIKIARWQPGQP